MAARMRPRVHAVIGRLAGAIGLVVAAGGCAPAGEGPVFPGHPMLATYTKELALEGSAVAFGDGAAATALGAAVGAYYRPWLGMTGGAAFSIGRRKHYDTRALLRLVWPWPLFGRVFPYATAGAGVFFPERCARLGPCGNDYERWFDVVYGGGAFVQVTERTRVRLEVRDAFLPGAGALEHDGFVTLGLVLLAR